MSNMQIVIEIPETLKKIAEEEDLKTFSHFMWYVTVMDAIKNGTPLPKGYGRLIDANELLNNLSNTAVYDDDYYYSIVYHAINAVPTIIEADKGE